MNKVEIAVIGKSLSTSQREVMVALDGRTSPLELNGTYRRTLDSLKSEGLVSYRRTHKSVAYGPARGSHMWSKSRVVLSVTLTEKGSEFVYNGGLDY